MEHKKTDGSLLIISRYELDCQTYHSKGGKVTWENCTLRSWLNNQFISSAFTSSEKSKIQVTSVINEANGNVSGGKTTQDSVFLLSISEAKKYFKNDNDEAGKLFGYSSARSSKPTSYAKARGCVAFEWNPSNYEDSDLKDWDGSRFDGCCGWWLRSPGRDNGYAAVVDVFGEVFEDGSTVGGTGNGFEKGSVRPAMWIKP